MHSGSEMNTRASLRLFLFAWVLSFVSVTGTGCHSRPSNGSVTTDSLVDDAIAHSFSYQRAKEAGGRAFWIVEGTGEWGTDVYIGHDMGTHIVRFATLWVDESGRVTRMDYDADREIVWIEDR